MYEKDLVKQGINLTWSPKALLEYASVTTESESHPAFLLYFTFDTTVVHGKLKL